MNYREESSLQKTWIKNEEYANQKSPKYRPAQRFLLRKLMKDL